ncbi:MAG TPA: response regulator transcription factor [Chitinophaga sp.]
MTNILIADDHTIVRLGITIIIRDMLPKVYISDVDNFDLALKEMAKRHYDLIILDINIPGGDNLQMIDVLRLRQPKIKILIFSAYDEELYALRYLQAGADGYLVKHSSEHEIKTALQQILNNEKYLSSNIRQQLANGNVKTRPAGNPLLALSNRETEVMQLLIKGSSVADISKTLHLQLSTVSTYKTRIFAKLEVSNIIELADTVRMYSSN